MSTIGSTKARSITAINNAVSAVRLSVLPRVAWQEQIEQQMLVEAKAYIADRAANGAGVPVPAYVAAVANAEAAGPLVVANAIVSRANAWNTGKGPASEGARLAGIKAVKAAATEDAVAVALQAALDAINAL